MILCFADDSTMRLAVESGSFDRIVEYSGSPLLALFNLINYNGTYRKTQKSQLLQKLCLQSVNLQEPYTALIDMGMVWRMATPTSEDRQKPDSTQYTWSDYVSKVVNIILARHVRADRIICVNDPYDAANSTKDNEKDLRAQGKAHIPNTYMKLDDPFPSAML